MDLQNSSNKTRSEVLTGCVTSDGAGVKLTRVFANEHAHVTDPFLLFDFFGSDNPADYIKGFPWHPHRGIETVTYMLEGSVDHEDNLGHKGTINIGDVQWMSAGSGIIHQEMPNVTRTGMRGFQLWVNLPAAKKMIAPHYRSILASEIPVVVNDGATIKIIAGSYDAHDGGTHTGPVKDLAVPIAYFDIALETGVRFTHKLMRGHTTCCYVFRGKGKFSGRPLHEQQLLLLHDGVQLDVIADESVRFLLFSGKPLGEPIAWGGPIVMNTKSELELAFKELRDGTFNKR